MNIITHFKQEGFEFLSNFYSCKVIWEGIEFPSSEHAYVASKTLDLELRKEIANSNMTSGQVKRFGRKIKVRKDWNEDLKVSLMLEIVRCKFQQNEDLKLKLLSTEDSIIQEGNHWGDTFWGICPVESNIGQNNLGKILMKVRTELKIGE